MTVKKKKLYPENVCFKLSQNTCFLFLFLLLDLQKSQHWKDISTNYMYLNVHIPEIHWQKHPFPNATQSSVQRSLGRQAVVMQTLFTFNTYLLMFMKDIKKFYFTVKPQQFLVLTCHCLWKGELQFLNASLQQASAHSPQLFSVAAVHWSPPRMDYWRESRIWQGTFSLGTKPLKPRNNLISSCSYIKVPLSFNHAHRINIWLLLQFYFCLPKHLWRKSPSQYNWKQKFIY